jgi:hypothetical protein
MIAFFDEASKQVAAKKQVATLANTDKQNDGSTQPPKRSLEVAASSAVFPPAKRSRLRSPGEFLEGVAVESASQAY